MTRKQQTALMRQILAMYEAFGAGHLYGSDEMVMLINELFNIAREAEPEMMDYAFNAGTRRGHVG